MCTLWSLHACAHAFFHVRIYTHTHSTQGEWALDSYHGQGTYKSAEAVYTGHFRQGKQHGRGKLVRRDRWEVHTCVCLVMMGVSHTSVCL
jgi:hypothetical protein